MSTKTNKSFTKRLKLTKNGKIKARKIGQGHFNAKKTGTERQASRRTTNFAMSKKNINRMMPHN